MPPVASQRPSGENAKSRRLAGDGPARNNE
jgi:hypothetical protein